MSTFINVASKTRQAFLIAVLAIAGLSGMVFGPLTESAAAVTCRNRVLYDRSMDWFTNYDNKEYQIATDVTIDDTVFTVPGSGVSQCSYVNVTNITGGWGTGGKCWSFRLHFYVSGTFTAESGYCAGPNDVLGIGGPVANGTQYEVYFIPNNSLHFTIRD